MIYHAFISYSHFRDMPLGSAIQTGLQRLGKPWYRLRQLTVFRDETDLSASPALWQRIEEALNRSEFFILFASPESAQSVWVQKEVTFWINNKDISKLIIVLTFGNIAWNNTTNDFDWVTTNVLPQNLSKQFKELPLYIDFTLLRDNPDLSLGNPQFKTNIAKISSAIQDIPLKELIDKDVREHRKTMRLRNTAIAVLVFFLIGLSLALVMITKQRNAAERIASANQHVVFALNKVSTTQSLFHSYLAYKLNPSPYTANLLTGFGEEPATFYDALKITDTVKVYCSAWSNGRIYTGYEKGLIKCINDVKEIVAEIQLPLQDIKKILPFRDSILAVYGHSVQSDETLLYLLEKNTLKIKSTIQLNSEISSTFQNEKDELVTGDRNGCIRFFSSGGAVRDSVQLAGIDDPIDALAQNAAGDFFVVINKMGVSDSVILQFNSHGTQVKRFVPQPGFSLKAMTYFAKTSQLLAVDEKGNSFLWTENSSYPQRASLIEDGIITSDGIFNINGCSFTPSGESYAILVNGSCVVRNLSGKIKAITSTLFGSIDCISFISEEKFLTSGMREPYIFFWNTSGYLLESRQIPTTEQMLWSKQSSDYCILRDDSLFVCQMNNQEKSVGVKTFFKDINFFSCDTSVFFVSNNVKGYLINKQNGQQLQEFSFNKEDRILFTDFTHQKIYLDNKKGIVKVFDWKNRKKDSIILRSSGDITFLKVHQSGKLLVGGGIMAKSAFLFLYDHNYKLERSFAGLTDIVNDALFSLDGTRVTTVDDGGKLMQWDLREGKVLMDVQVGTGTCMEVKAMPDESYYLVNDMLSNSVHLLDAKGLHLQAISFETEPSAMNFINADQFYVSANNYAYKMLTINGFMKSDRIARQETIDSLEFSLQPFVVNRLIRNRIISNKSLK